MFDSRHYAVHIPATNTARYWAGVRKPTNKSSSGTCYCEEIETKRHSEWGKTCGNLNEKRQPTIAFRMRCTLYITTNNKTHTTPACVQYAVQHSTDWPDTETHVGNRQKQPIHKQKPVGSDVLRRLLLRLLCCCFCLLPKTDITRSLISVEIHSICVCIYIRINGHLCTTHCIQYAAYALWPLACVQENAYFKSNAKDRCQSNTNQHTKNKMSR